jgi:hypothetical protein
MTRKTNFLARAGNFLAILGAAGASAAAVEAHRAPRARDLKVLGISPDAFRHIDL